jgi:arylsulfatase A-like enzyme
MLGRRRHDHCNDCSSVSGSGYRLIGFGLFLVLGVMGMTASSFSANGEAIAPDGERAEGEARQNAGEAVDETGPSILLVVLDTVRADAVSSYGKVDGTTPTIDRLAASGIRYSNAFAPAPWTLPSHATIFTGRRVDEHRVAMPGHPTLTDDFETLAETLSNAGYETVAFSENALVSDLFELLRGFDVRETTTLRPDDQEKHIHEELVDARDAFRKWLVKRDSDRPFFAFVNLLDAHRPYEIRSNNPWVPPDATPQAVKDRHPAPERLLCGGLPTTEQLQIQRGLYLGDVHAADQKLEEILGAARDAMGGGRLITIVTSDHGELFGEDSLMGHEFSLHSSLLRVPLVVHGVDGAVAGVVDAPVGLEDLMPSVLGWVGAAFPDGLSGSRLPLAKTTDGEGVASRMFFSAYSDRFLGVPPEFEGQVQPKDKDRLRQFCGPSNRVRGGMAALIQYPFKYVWFENYPSSLYDLSWDSAERSDQSPYKSDLVETFEARMRIMRAASGIEKEPDAAADGLSEEAIEALRQLGYTE